MGVMAEFDARATWGETHVCDHELRARLQALGADWGRADGEPAAVRGAAVHWVRGGALLVFLPAGEGYAGILCEAGEWLAIPHGMRHALETGDAAELDLRVLDREDRSARQHEPVRLHPDLPRYDDFIDTLLALTGHAADD